MTNLTPTILGQAIISTVVLEVWGDIVPGLALGHHMLADGEFVYSVGCAHDKDYNLSTDDIIDAYTPDTDEYFSIAIFRDAMAAYAHMYGQAEKEHRI